MGLKKPSIHVTLFSLFIKKASVCVISVTGHLLVPGFLIKDKALAVIGQIVNKGVSEHLHITVNKKIVILSLIQKLYCP